MADLRIAVDLALPVEAVTQTFAILAKRGVGKTYTALVLVEGLLKAGLQTTPADTAAVRTQGGVASEPQPGPDDQA